MQPEAHGKCVGFALTAIDSWTPYREISSSGPASIAKCRVTRMLLR
jgi:hypothetical protein